MKDRILSDNLPQHIAVIMDGNGRWAKQKGAQRIFGHKNAINAVRDISEGCAELGVNYLTLYAFSTENWGRPRYEVDALMNLLVSTIRSETKTLMENKIKLNTIGDLDHLPKKCLKELNEAKEITKDNDNMVLTLALSYSGRWEILEAVKSMIKDGMKPEEVNDESFRAHLFDPSLPDPELLIRTSGELRISNFLLWQLAYSELYFTNTLWPDFRKKHLYEALIEYQQRERRFGKTSEQLKAH
ncbi:isoprenyl transferase [Hyphobacterium sp. CCMP332]|nr:isoprenyl transferase [Hyphobacterium sp. CCMP332]